MSASIGRVSQVLSFLVGCLAFPVVGGRAEQPAGTAQAPTPPVSSKQIPVSTKLPPLPSKQFPVTTIKCDPCTASAALAQNPVTSTAPATWTNGKDYVITLQFGDNGAYTTFMNTQQGYLCFQNSSTPLVMWHYKRKDPGMAPWTCTLTVTACGLKANDGTGTGRIIVTDYKGGVWVDSYQAGPPLINMQ
jgi:hypothetical protein